MMTASRIPALPVASFFLVAGVMGSRPLVPLFAVEIGIGTAEIGVLVAAFAFVPLALAAFAGPWMDRNGSGPPLLLGIITATLGVCTPFILTDRVGLYISQLGAGIGFTLFILAGQKLAGMAGTGLSRERSVAAFSLGIAMGSLVGPLVGGLTADGSGYNIAFLILGLVILLAIFPLGGSFSRKQAPLRAPVLPNISRSPLRVLTYHTYMARAFLVSMLILIGKDMYVAYFPIYALAAGMSASWIGMVVAVHNVGGVIMRFFLIPMVTAFGKNAVLIVSVMSAGICFLLLPATQDPIWLMVISILMGFGLGIGQPLSISRTINLSPSDRIGKVLGMRLASNRLTQFITPLLVGAVSMVAGLSGIFLATGTVLIVGSLKLRVPFSAEHASNDEQVQ